MSSTTGGSNRYNEYSPGSSGWSTLSLRNVEFQEADVWGVTWETKVDHHHLDSYSRRQQQPPSSAAALTIPKPINTHHHHRISSPNNTFQQSSAPVNIPDWSKIYGSYHYQSDDVGDDNKNNSWDSDDDDDEDEGLMVPPHEWISRKAARSKMSSFSVYEGMGRTLKGRDLSNVRNAVLTKTGFLE